MNWCLDVITTTNRAIVAYEKVCAGKSELERTELNKDKTGVFTGAYAINPVNRKKIPIWISDYVWQLMELVLLWRFLLMIIVIGILRINLVLKSSSTCRW